MDKKKKINITSFIAIVLFIAIALIIYALFTSKEEDKVNINVGNLEVVLREEWPEDVPETGIDRHSKQVWGESIAEKKAYVRMRFIPIVEYYFVGSEDGIEMAEWRTAPISQEYIRLTIADNENWVKDGDYYYYKKILNPSESTDKLDLNWEIIEIPSTVAQYSDIRGNVRVILEYAQTSNDLWKDTFQIEELPEGVEK